VMLLDVIEHLSKPNELLLKCEEVLDKKGYLIISTPNNLSLDAFFGKLRQLVIGKKYIAWDPTHKKIFSSIEIVSSLRQHFEVINVYGYYFLPCLPSTFFERINTMLLTKVWPLNRLGFLTIILVRKST
jgi:2-polyprenyl-3-methyl-5-hydroxy-6-metoxy-1,4-benzoquinol methylase